MRKTSRMRADQIFLRFIRVHPGKSAASRRFLPPTTFHSADPAPDDTRQCHLRLAPRCPTRHAPSLRFPTSLPKNAMAPPPTKFARQFLFAWKKSAPVCHHTARHSLQPAAETTAAQLLDRLSRRHSEPSLAVLARQGLARNLHFPNQSLLAAHAQTSAYRIPPDDACRASRPSPPC